MGVWPSTVGTTLFCSEGFPQDRARPQHLATCIIIRGPHAPISNEATKPVLRGKALPPKSLQGICLIIFWGQQWSMVTQMIYCCFFGGPYFPDVLPHFLSLLEAIFYHLLFICAIVATTKSSL